MLRLLTFCSLLIIGAAQSGYEYSKPGKPFGQATTPSYFGPASSIPSSPTSAPFATGNYDEYSNSGYGSTPGPSPGPTSFPPGPHHVHYGGGLTDAPHPASVFPGQTQNSPSNIGLSGGANPNFPGSLQSYPGQNFHEDGQNFNGQYYPVQQAGAPGSVGAPVFGPIGPAYSGDDNGLYEGDYSAIPGEPEKDYPIFAAIPQTSFSCSAQPYPGYYADVEARCQVFHICANNITYDFLCPNGTIFSQEYFVCVWWNQFDCNLAPSLYELNANIYDYSITGAAQQAAYSPTDLTSQVSGTYQGFPTPKPFPPQQGPFNVLPGNVAQGPHTSYPTPISSYPTNVGFQDQSGNLAQGGLSPQGPPVHTFPGHAGAAAYPVSSAAQGSPANNYGPTHGSSGSTHSSNRPQAAPHSTTTSPYEPSVPYPNRPSSYPNVNDVNAQSYTSTHSPTFSGGLATPNSYPTQMPSFSTSRPTQGNSYKPSSTGFSAASNGRPQGPHGDSFTPQQPNREYLPPRN